MASRQPQQCRRTGSSACLCHGAFERPGAIHIVVIQAGAGSFTLGRHWRKFRWSPKSKDQPLTGCFPLTQPHPVMHWIVLTCVFLLCSTAPCFLLGKVPKFQQSGWGQRLSRTQNIQPKIWVWILSRREFWGFTCPVWSPLIKEPANVFECALTHSASSGKLMCLSPYQDKQKPAPALWGTWGRSHQLGTDAPCRLVA